MQNGRTKTFVDGFDEVLGGGIPEKKVVVIKGSTGTMKSSMAYYILFRNAEIGKKSLYITFEQDKRSLEQQMMSLGLDGMKVSDKLNIFDLSRGREKLEEMVQKIRVLGSKESRKRQNHETESILTSLLQRRVEDLKERMGFELVVIDSLDALQMVLDPRRPREAMFEFFEWMRNLGLTSFVICEKSLHTTDNGRTETQYEDFLADGIIELKMELINNVDVQRRIRCVKMRGTKHSSDYYSFFCGRNNFEITKAMTH